MKSLLPKLASLSVLAVPLALSAHSIEERLDTLETEMQSISARTPQDTLGACFTSDRPEVPGTNWYGTFDITYWHTKMGGTEYAYSVRQFNPNNQPFVTTQPLPVDGDVKDNDFSWDVGVKVGLGYKTPHDMWDVFARYTWYETENTNSSFKSSPSALVSIAWVIDLVAMRAKSHIKIDYNNVDMELARSYFQSGLLSFRPHFGLKSSWVHLNRDIVFTDNGTFTDGGSLGLDFKAKERLQFWGLGPRAGLDSKWYLGYNFHIFADVAASILYGYFNTKQSNQVPPSTDPDDIPDGVVFKMRHKFHRFVPFAQMFFGLGWESFINDDKQHLLLKLGYEVQYFWRVNQNHQPEDISGQATGPNQSLRIQFEKQSEDLMFYGITGEIRLDF